MNWLSNAWKSLFLTRDEVGFRDAARDLPPVEHLEARLCLGSMHASSVADWSADSLDDMSLANEVLLASRLDEAEQTDADVAGDDDYAPISGDDSSEQYSATTPQPSTRESAATLTSPKLRSGLSGDQLQSGMSTETNSSGDQPTDPTRQSSVTDSDQQTAATSGTSQTDAGGEQQSTSTAATPTAQNTAASSNSGSSQNNTGTSWDANALAAYGLRLDDQGNAIGLADSDAAAQLGYEAWWKSADEPVVIKYDFRDQAGTANVITAEQQAIAVQALQRWSDAVDGKVVFQRDTDAAADHIINIGAGDLSAFGHVSGTGGVLGLSGGRVVVDESGSLVASGVAWLDRAEVWENTIGNGDVDGTFDFSTVVSHEIGHTLGYGDTFGGTRLDMMDGTYTGERLPDAINYAVAHGYFERTVEDASASGSDFEVRPLMAGDIQLKAAEVAQLLKRASVATASEDAIIAVVDRNGRILGVRVEAGVLTSFDSVANGGNGNGMIDAGSAEEAKLVFAIDGAVAKARTAALFSNGDPTNGPNGTLAPLTSRTVRFLSQSTVTQREVESNPNDDGTSLATASVSTTRGPGFVAPIGVGAHFPPEIPFTPQVDLFAIEHTNRDSNKHPGADGIKGTGDDITLPTAADGTGRFNIDLTKVPMGQGIFAPESYGHVQNSGLLPNAQSRGIATLPGGIPLFRDTDHNGRGDTLVGGIGVFFPGADGYATHEQGFIPGVGQTEAQRNNAARVLEAEYIAFAAAGGSLTAQQDFSVTGAQIGTINGVAAVPHLDLPFGRLDLVGITLEVFGPTPGKWGVHQLVAVGNALGVGADSGADQLLLMSDDGMNHRDGKKVPEGWLVTPHAGVGITAAEVDQIINQGILAANEVRAAVRLPLSSRTRMVFAVTDTTGEVLGLYRMQDATTFSIDVAVAKARNVAYYADATAIKPIDQVIDSNTGMLVTPGTAFTNRTFRFLSQPRFPSGIDGTPPAPFSILNDDSLNPLTAENTGGPAMVGEFTSVLGHDAFFPSTNFRDTDNVANQNGIVFFPGSTPLYRNSTLIGGLGVSGDGVDQDDVVTFVAALGFQADGNATRADEKYVRGIRLPFQKFLRNPFG